MERNEDLRTKRVMEWGRKLFGVVGDEWEPTELEFDACQQPARIVPSATGRKMRMEAIWSDRCE